VRYDVVRERIAVLDERDRARQRAAITVADPRRKRLAGPVAPPGHYAACCCATTPPVRSPRASTNAVSEDAPNSAAATPKVQRAPATAAKPPALRIPMPSSALWALMITVNARPRTRSEVCRWMMRTLIGNARPLPKPFTAMAKAPTQMLGAI